ncbi:MAG TPA: precorrin-3B C(17)-methyltransferase, partial [Desulfobulbaceae bacterium]|nr:precorrin-3B C(17)-methyltransferase [Desulfobulbaceae bacterium]
VDKEVISSEMMKEIDRCRQALDITAAGRDAALVCGGDPGIYAMAGLVFELAREMNHAGKIEIIPGLAAVNSCAARLGAPLMHDFCAISLSDLLTPMELIEKRLIAAAEADFVTAIYNPKSKRRTSQISLAQDIFLRYRAPETPVGIVTAASRADESIIIARLDTMASQEITMRSLVIIGNSQTRTWDGLMVTPRGYQQKYGF